MNERLRALPPVHRLLDDPRVTAFTELLGKRVVKDAVAAVLECARGEHPIPPYDAIVARIEERLASARTRALLPVVNATGILVHTNLGRAPLARSALAEAVRIGEGYSNLEYDLDAGTRGSRYERVTDLLREITGAEDALVVNNNAAAVLLILDALAKGREVVVSRGELIEIGGGFRLPDVLARSGARLVEVGATNKTYLRDVEHALTPQTALLLRSHLSNYRIEGFVHAIAPAELAELGHRVGIPVVEDLGSGALVPLEEYGLPHERTVQDALADGMDLVAFSGDKLLGGPQAGIVVGRAPLIARLRSDPLLRALRVDKLTLAALAQTLRLLHTPEGRMHLPLYAMIAAPLDSLRARAQRYADAIASAMIVETTAYLGGGTLPTRGFPSVGVAVATAHPHELATHLRRHDPPVIARVEDDRVLLDLRTVAPPQDEIVLRALRALER